MEIYFWGVRGSIASPGPHTVRFGGNTTCVEIRDGDEFILIDCGTGIRDAGNHILSNFGTQNDINILMTHTHWDHIQGFPFFVPAFIPGNNIQILGPHLFETPFDTVMQNQMQYSYFPVNFEQLGSTIINKTLFEEKPFQLGSIKVTPKYINHPIRTLAYRFEKDNKCIVFLTDMEPYYDVIYHGVCPDDDEREEFEEVQATVAMQNQTIIDFCTNADILCIDAQYTHKEYVDKIGWGHTSMEDAIQIAHKAKVRDVIFFHHDPMRTDDELDRLLDHHSQMLSNLSNTSIKFLDGAREKIAYKA